ncbi:hypothetical protein [Sphingomonas sp.]|uniref:hypothetical protein n=1 Tax=Sphingomonas sp. TaxID=28214 RepID=UPI000DB5517F|nr:hypothetical protein [Sphingomonas sp.]PZU11835.1 MAG: hypothetical protein DI605_02420 [Sphingomonas sp.]
MRERPVGAQGNWRIFRWPLAIGLASAVGLVAALIGDGPYDIVSWIALGLTIVVMIAAWRGWSAA